MANLTSSNDSSFSDDRDPSVAAQAQAALLLIESLLHTLLDNGTLTKEQVLEAIGSAFEVKEESADEDKESKSTLRRSLGLLSSMRNSISAHTGRYDDHPGVGRESKGKGKSSD